MISSSIATILLKKKWAATTRPKRTQLAIIADIIRMCGKEPLRKSHVMFKANLSYELLKKYLSLTTKADLLERDSAANNSVFYTPTKKGYEFLKVYDEVMKLERKATEKRKMILRALGRH